MGTSSSFWWNEHTMQEAHIVARSLLAPLHAAMILAAAPFLPNPCTFRAGPSRAWDQKLGTLPKQ